MDLNLARSLVTLVAFAAFLAVVFWAYRPARRAELDRQGRSILDEDRAS